MTNNTPRTKVLGLTVDAAHLEVGDLVAVEGRIALYSVLNLWTGVTGRIEGFLEGPRGGLEALSADPDDTFDIERTVAA